MADIHFIDPTKGTLFGTAAVLPRKLPSASTYVYQRPEPDGYSMASGVSPSAAILSGRFVVDPSGWSS